MPHLENHTYILEAVKTQDRELVVKAFMNDPNVREKCQNEAQIRQLVDDMIKNTEKYLPEGWK